MLDTADRATLRRSAKCLALTAHVTGLAMIALATFGVVAGASAAFGQTRLPPSAAAARLAISEVCGVAPRPSFTELDLSFASASERRRMTYVSKARLQRSPERASICQTARSKGFRQ